MDCRLQELHRKGSKRLCGMYALIILTGLLGFASSKSCDTESSTDKELILSLTEELLHSLEGAQGPPNPSVYLALRLSDYHDLNNENDYLDKLRTILHNDIQNSLSNTQPVSGLLGLYALALKASCIDPTRITFNVNGEVKSLLFHLKRQMENENEHIAHSQHPRTNYYQFSLGILALCMIGTRINPYVSNKLINYVEHGDMRSGNAECVDTLAMAGMALQCVKRAGSHVQNPAELHTAIEKIKEKLLTAQRSDGHIGNEFSTGLAIQTLLAMGSEVEEYDAAMKAIRSDAKRKTYHNPMAISQILPALHQKSYLQINSILCQNENDCIGLEHREPPLKSHSHTKVELTVVVVTSNGEPMDYTVKVPVGSSLLEALERLMRKNIGFTFEKESSLWGHFLSAVNGEQARQQDRKYWRLSLTSDDSALTEGIGDYKIEEAKSITIKNTSY